MVLERVGQEPQQKQHDRQMHDELQDFLDIYDELDDNLDTFVERKSDLRKPLKLVIEADAEFQARLRAVKSGSNSRSPAASQYEFLLNTALETVDSSVADHRQLLAEQQEAAKHRKK